MRDKVNVIETRKQNMIYFLVILEKNRFEVNKIVYLIIRANRVKMSFSLVPAIYSLGHFFSGVMAPLSHSKLKARTGHDVTYKIN